MRPECELRSAHDQDLTPPAIGIDGDLGNEDAWGRHPIRVRAPGADRRFRRRGRGLDPARTARRRPIRVKARGTADASIGGVSHGDPARWQLEFTSSERAQRDRRRRSRLCPEATDRRAGHRRPRSRWRRAWVGQSPARRLPGRPNLSCNGTIDVCSKAGHSRDRRPCGFGSALRPP